MGVVAPLSAVVGAGLPLLVGVLGGERPGPVTLLGVVGRAGGHRAGHGGHRRERPATRIGPLLGLAAGVGFGAVLHRAGRDAARLRPVAAGGRPGGHGGGARRAGADQPVGRPAEPADDRQRAGGHRGERRVPAGHPARRPRGDARSWSRSTRWWSCCWPGSCCGERLTPLQLTGAGLAWAPACCSPPAADRRPVRPARRAATAAPPTSPG